MANGARNRRGGTSKSAAASAEDSEARDTSQASVLQFTWNAQGGFDDNSAPGVTVQTTTTLPIVEYQEMNVDMGSTATAPEPTTTRRGRVIKKPSFIGDFAFGGEMETEIEVTSKRPQDSYTADHSRLLPKQNVKPSSLMDTQGRKDSRLGIEATLLAHANLNMEDEGEAQLDTDATPSSLESTMVRSDVSSRNASLGTSAPDAAASQEFDGDVKEILELLHPSRNVFVDLPEVVKPADPNTEVPYTGRALTQLYLACYERGLWNLCDLVVDTWIRAFHVRRRQAKHNSELELWRPNPALDERMQIARRNARLLGKSTSSPKLTVADPCLHTDVTSFDNGVLNMLYEGTSANCGARILWADAMALAGYKTERLMKTSKQRGINWHKDLEHEIMCTSLRLARRKLTLKIEEVTEGAWCERYHEHGKHGQVCYRELALQEKDDIHRDAGVQKRQIGQEPMELDMESEYEG